MFYTQLVLLSTFRDFRTKTSACLRDLTNIPYMDRETRERDPKNVQKKTSKYF